MTIIEIKHYRQPEGDTFYLHHNGKCQIFQSYPTLEKRLQEIFCETTNPAKMTHYLSTPNRYVTTNEIECLHCHWIQNKYRSHCARCHTEL